MSIAWLEPGILWDDWVQQCPGTPATLTGAWARSQAWGKGQAIAMSVRLNGSRLALLPLVVTPRRAACPWPYGGFVSLSPLAEDEARWIIRQAQGTLGALQLRNNPFSPHPNLPLTQAPFWRKPARSTHVLALGKLEALRLGYQAHRRLSILLGQALDVHADIHPCSPQHWLMLYQQAMSAWRPDVALDPLSLALWWQGAAPHLHLAVARRHGEWVGFAPFSILGGVAHLHGWCAQLQAPEVITTLLEAAFQHALDCGAHWWDFGPGEASLAVSFGATPWPRYTMATRHFPYLRSLRKVTTA